MKFVALYLPQYHEIPENNLWWGDGYTEWSAVKNAKPLFSGHYQPHVPYKDNYYDLSDTSAKTWKWQSQLAKEYGISVFCIYHYWFDNGKQLLQKPAEILLEHKEIDCPFCFCWANESWTRTWYGLQKEVLMAQKYGDENEIIEHFAYLLPFFKDNRYWKISNKPVFCLYKSADISNINLLISIWNRLAKENGFSGIYFVSANTNSGIDKRDIFDARYNFEPDYSLKHQMSGLGSLYYYSHATLQTLFNHAFKSKKLERVVPIDFVNKAIKKSAKKNAELELKLGVPNFTGLFPSFDNTPRRGYKGLVYTHATPEKFRKTLCAVSKYLPDDSIIFVNAWNEWGEGCYLEPDEKNGFQMLSVIKEKNK
jgi:hypothetical protein